MMLNKIFLLLVITLLMGTMVSSAVEFEPPRILESVHKSIGFPFNTSGAIAVTSDDQVNLAMFGNLTSDFTADSVFLLTLIDRTVTLREVSNALLVDARHPSIAIDQAGTFHVAWQDSRHATAAGNFMDNLEIFYNTKPADGEFLQEDIRVSHTEANHLGDNGYSPSITVDNQGRVSIAWYDFNEDGNHANLYLRTSEPGGAFPEVVGIADFKLDVGDSDSSYWMPDVVSLSDEDLYVIWGQKEFWQGFFVLQGCTISRTRVLGSVEAITDSGGTLTDPPRLASNNAGETCIVYTNRVDGINHVYLHYRPQGRGWSLPLQLNITDVGSTHPSVALTNYGTAYAVWQSGSGGWYQIEMAEIDLNTLSTRSRMVLSDENTNVQTPTVAVNPETNRLHCAWIDRTDETVSNIVYRPQKQLSIRDWALY